jgi:oxygen-dependent protoporphyrinogen oxidase
MARVIVVGAGISGLACAHALSRAGADVRVLEASGRAGGVIDTIEREGFRFESGPNSIPGRARSFRALVSELGLADRLLGSSPQAKKRYLLHRGKLVALPSSPLSFLFTPLLSMQGKRAILTEPLRRYSPPGRPSGEPTLLAFLSERIGVEATERFAGAFVRGVYAAELDELGAASAFPRLWTLAVENGGLVRGLAASLRRGKTTAQDSSPLASLAAPDSGARSSLLGFPLGQAELPRALATALGERLVLRTRVSAVHRRDDGWSVDVERDESRACDWLVLAVPAPVAHALLAPLLEGSPFREHLARVNHARVTLVHLGLADEALPEGFGFLVPPDESRRDGAPKLLGALFVSNLFPGRVPENLKHGAAVTLFYPTAAVEHLGDADLAAFAHDELARVTRVRPRLVTSLVQRWRDVIPRYAPGHAARIAEVERELRSRAPRLSLAGSYVGGVSVEDCIARGRSVAAGILRQNVSAGAAERHEP